MHTRSLTLLLLDLTLFAFLVPSAYSGETITVSAQTIPEGQCVSISGSGFTPNGPVQIYLSVGGTPHLIASTTAGNAGFWSLGCVYMNFAGTDQLYAVDTNSNTQSPPITMYLESTSVNCSPSTIGVGSSTSCTATVTGFFPTGSVSFTQGTPGTGTVTFSPFSSCTLTSASCSVTATGATVGSGSDTITASYSGDSHNAPSSGTFSLTVNPATSVTSLSVGCTASILDVGVSTTCTATVSGESGSISGETITFSQVGGTGSVTFPSGNTCDLSGASCSVSIIADPGGVTLKASYPGDTNNAASSGTFNLTVTSASPIPEYSFGVPVLAMLMLLAYAVIKRRLR